MRLSTAAAMSTFIMKCTPPRKSRPRYMGRACKAVSQAGERDSSVIEEQLQLLAPLLRTRLGSSCPHCEHPHTIDFDLVSYSQRCFQRDQAMLTREIHCLGSAYRFGYEEILGMPRSVRQELVTLLLGQRSRGAA